MFVIFQSPSDAFLKSRYARQRLSFLSAANVETYDELYQRLQSRKQEEPWRELQQNIQTVKSVDPSKPKTIEPNQITTPNIFGLAALAIPIIFIVWSQQQNIDKEADAIEEENKQKKEEEAILEAKRLQEERDMKPIMDAKEAIQTAREAKNRMDELAKQLHAQTEKNQVEVAAGNTSNLHMLNLSRCTIFCYVLIRC